MVSIIQKVEVMTVMVLKEAIIEEMNGWINGVSNGGVGGRIDIHRNSKKCTDIHFLNSLLICNLLIIVHFYICCYNPKSKQEK